LTLILVDNIFGSANKILKIISIQFHPSCYIVLGAPNSYELP